MAIDHRRGLASAVTLALVLAAVLPVAALGTWFVTTQREAVTQRSADGIVLLADAQHARLEMAHQSAVSTLKLIASRTQMRQDLAAIVAGDATPVARLSRIIDDARMAADDVHTIVLTDVDGQVIAAAGSDRDVVTAAAQQIVAGYARPVTGGTTAGVAAGADGSWTHIIEVDGISRWLMASWLELQGEVVGAVVVELPMEPMIAVVAEAPASSDAVARATTTCMYHRGVDGEAVPITLAASADGSMRCGRGAYGDDRHVAAVPATMTDDPAQMALAATDALLEDAVDAHGRSVVAAVRHVTVPDWGLTVTVDRDVVLAPVRAATTATFIATLAVALLAAAVALVVARRLTSPLVALRAAVVEVTNPVHDRAASPPALKGPGELGDVAVAFAEMAHTVAMERLALEHRVAELQIVTHAMAHDLKSPLTSIKGMLDLLNSGRVTDAELRSTLVDRSMGAADRMQRLIDELLVIASAQQGALEVAPVDLDKVVREAAASISPDVVEIAHLPRIDGDEVLLRQMFVNLIGNAVAYHAEGVTPQVVITTSSDVGDGPGAEDGSPGGESVEGFVAVHVDDAGVGIPADERDDVVKMFVRGSRTHGTPGTGIGLTIVAQVVERHGGRLELTDSALGGTRVTVWLPLAR